MKKSLPILLIFTMICCNKNNESEKIQAQTIDTKSVISDSIKTDTIKTAKEIKSEPENTLKINTFSELPQRYSNESDANAYFFTDSNQAEKNGIKYAVCDFINNVLVLKINNKFEKLNDISGKDSYLEDKNFENANYRVELDLNEKISDKLQNKIISNIPIEGAYTLKGKIKVIDLTNNNELTKDTFVIGF
ncbi:hypothetical protein [Empedobacter stercoris]|uniref:hypothetical protein n=1 Tax=Empedobacter stercoris TaxID=1628248 RepID=UPI001CE184CC|nr:hypothetical protein [Empedobacter stercoris]MCA4777430.1 hypothetical protein [Empedobacter stercoris]